jgi:hypothetical protein
VVEPVVVVAVVAVVPVVAEVVPVPELVPLPELVPASRSAPLVTVTVHALVPSAKHPTNNTRTIVLIFCP